MDVIFNTSKLLHLLKDFHLMSGVRAGFYDCEFREIVSYPVYHSDFCKMIRAQAKLFESCKHCDSEAFTHAKGCNDAYVYRCHAGLIESAAAIRNGEETIGYLMFGQMRDEEDKFMQLNILQESPALSCIDRGQLESAFYKLQSIESEKIHAYAHILQACAVFASLDGYVQIRRRNLSENLDRYIATHLEASLTLNELTNQFGVGKTTLCSCAKEHFGMSIGSLIKRRRIEKAKELLMQTDDSIASIAENVGIPDYNYFSKVFKAETGLTPTGYRKLNMASTIWNREDEINKSK